MTAALLAGCSQERQVTEAAGSCTGCHGGDNGNAAPPRDTNGSTDSIAVGAHQQHLAVGVLCTDCHQVPARATDPSDPKHMNGKADVDFSGLAAQDATPAPSYDAAAHTCSNVYCHGTTLDAGGTAAGHAPAWNAGALTCGSCHGAPPPSPHPTGTACGDCHAGYTQTTVNPATHANGTVDLAESYHGANWVVASGVQPHGQAALYHDARFPNGLTSCKGCHGPDLASCATCHGPNWNTVAGGCTFCHGATKTATNASNDRLETAQAAPPVDTYGNASASQRHVGAHAAHVFGDALSDGVACASCHASPDYTDTAHVEANKGVASVTLVKPGTTTQTGTFDPTAATCASTYCHGSFPNGKKTNAPAWTDTSAAPAACGACHSAQTSSDQTGAHWFHINSEGAGCSMCHGTGYAAGSITGGGKATHVNGKIDMVVGSGVNWNAQTRTCSGSCHSPALNGQSDPWPVAQ